MYGERHRRAERRNFETLNLLRGLAALTVLVWHLPGTEQKSYWSGYLSVDLFFSLSGVVVAHAYKRRLLEGWRFRRFVIARVIRLWPLYLLGSAVTGVVGIAGAVHAGGAAWMFKPLVMDAWRSVLLWPRLSGGAEFPLDPPAWSLLAEFVVNNVYGLVLVRWSSRRLATVALAAAIVMTAGAVHFRLLDTALTLDAVGEHSWMGSVPACPSSPLAFSFIMPGGQDVCQALRSRPVLAGALLVVSLVMPGKGRWAAPAALAVVIIVLPALVAADANRTARCAASRRTGDGGPFLPDLDRA